MKLSRSDFATPNFVYLGTAGVLRVPAQLQHSQGKVERNPVCASTLGSVVGILEIESR